MPERHKSRWTATDGVRDTYLIQIMCYLDASVTTTATKSELADALACSTATVSRALDGLCDDGVVDCVLAGNTTIYWLTHPESEWPVPKDVELVTDGSFDTAADSEWHVLRGDPPVMWRHLSVAGCYLTIMQAVGALVAGLWSQALAEQVLAAAIITLTTVVLLGLAFVVRVCVAPRLSERLDNYLSCTDGRS